MNTLMQAFRRIPFARKVYNSARQRYKFNQYQRTCTQDTIPLVRVNIEFTNICDLNCRFCILDNSAPKGFMSLDTLQNALTQLASPQFAIDEIALHHAGETLLHKQLDLMLAEFYKRKHHPNFRHITLLTNATHLNEKTIPIILESRAIDVIFFSVDGGNPEQFEYIRRTRFDKVLNNIHAFLAANQKAPHPIKTGLISILEPNAPLCPEFLALTKAVDDYRPRTLHNWDGSQDLGLSYKPTPRTGFCNHVYRTLSILSDGHVSPCCNDLNHRGLLGHIAEKPLFDIFRDQPLRLMVDKMHKHQRCDIELCRNCEL